MDEKARRRELLADYKQAGPEAGVYRVVNSGNGKMLVGWSLNLASELNKLAFSKTTRMGTGLDHRLTADVRAFGIDAFSIEILEKFEPRPDMTTAQIREELATMAELWRESYDAALQY